MGRRNMSQKLSVDSISSRSACTYRGFADRLVLVALVFLLQSCAQGATVEASKDVQGLGPSQRRVSLYDGRGGGLPPRLHTLRGNRVHTTDHELGQFLDDQHDRRRLITGLFINRPLAVRGDRVDPLNKLRHYRAGLDVTSKHYWASVAYTGIYGYAIGVAWLLLGLILALFLCSRCCCRRRRRRRERSKDPHSSLYYWLPRLLVLLLTLFALGCLLALFVHNQQLRTQANKVKSTIVGAAAFATDTVHTVSSTLTRVESAMAKYHIPGLDALNSTGASLNQQADSITSKVNSNVNTLNRAINDVEIALIVILSVALFIAVSGLVPSFLRWRRIFFVIIVLGWILAALTWLLFGIFFSLNNVASDTCEALNEYLQAPANTTLDNLLPCMDLAIASSAFTVAREGISNIIQEANDTVTTIQRVNNRLGRGNGSIEGLCNPIGGPPDYTYTGACPAGTLPIADLPQVVESYVCMDNMTTLACLREGRFVTPGENRTLYEFSDGAQKLLDVIPAISGLSNCSFVYDTFTAFVNRRCNPAKTALRNLWIPLLLLSIALTLLTLSWLVANHRNTQQRYLGTIHAQDYFPKGRPN